MKESITEEQRQEQQTESDSQHGSLRLLTETLKAKLTMAQLKVVKEIGYTISKSGLALGDAALLAHTSLDEINEWSNEVPELTSYFRLKTLQYKFNLLKIINDQAIGNADVKQATWLLEQHFASDYNPGIKKEMAKLQRGDGEDLMAMAISFVRRSSEEKTPIQARKVEDKKEEETTYQVLGDVLV